MFRSSVMNTLEFYCIHLFFGLVNLAIYIVNKFISHLTVNSKQCSCLCSFNVAEHLLLSNVACQKVSQKNSFYKLESKCSVGVLEGADFE